MECLFCKEPTKNIKYCSEKCRRKAEYHRYKKDKKDKKKEPCVCPSCNNDLPLKPIKLCDVCRFNLIRCGVKKPGETAPIYCKIQGCECNGKAIVNHAPMSSETSVVSPKKKPSLDLRRGVLQPKDGKWKLDGVPVDMGPTPKMLPTDERAEWEKKV